MEKRSVPLHERPVPRIESSWTAPLTLLSPSLSASGTSEAGGVTTSVAAGSSPSVGAGVAVGVATGSSPSVGAGVAIGISAGVATGSSPIVGVGIGVAVCPQASNVSSAERSITSAGRLEIMGGTLQPLGIIACILGWHQQDSCFLRLRLSQTQNLSCSLRRALTIHPAI